MEDLRLELHAHCFEGTFFCPLCGQSFEERFTCAVFKEGEEGQQFAADICPECLSTGPTGAATRIKDYSARLREKADNLNALAERIRLVHPDKWVWPAQLGAKEKEIESVMIGVSRTRETWETARAGFDHSHS